MAANDAQVRKLGREVAAIERLGLKTIRPLDGGEIEALG